MPSLLFIKFLEWYNERYGTEYIVTDDDLPLSVGEMFESFVAGWKLGHIKGV